MGKSCFVDFCVLLVISAGSRTPSLAQTFNTLISFNGENGATPLYESLVQGTDGNFYGTTSGVTQGAGTIFKMTPSGTLTTLYSLPNGSKGASLQTGLVLARSGEFYGTTYYGGAHDLGAVFRITASGTLTNLYSFSGADGAFPTGQLVQANGGEFYGATAGGGSSNLGTIFKITSSGTLTIVHSFGGPDGSGPNGALVQAANGYFYGTTSTGGANNECQDGCGTIFRMAPGGTLTTLLDFDAFTGEVVRAGLVEAANGYFYGTAYDGGYRRNGTVFGVTPRGVLVILDSLVNSTGIHPFAGLVQATDGNFYGATAYGGSNSAGTIFEMTGQGVITTLHNFGLATYGTHASGGLVQGTDGSFYGTTMDGGRYGWGTVYSFSTGLSPFVRTLPVSGKPRSAVKILGTNLTGAISVTFNGATALFTVVSPTEITTQVPTGASTGTVQVVTPSGTLASNIPFRVTP